MYGLIVEVEGIIGSGKTTLARQLAQELHLRLFEEPVGSNPYLSPFYKDPKAYAYRMQIYLLHRRFVMHQAAAWEAMRVGDYHGAILDRSLRGDRVFAKLHQRAGNIEGLDWDAYEFCYAAMVHMIQPPTVLLWLEVEPEKALERIQRRARGVEVGITVDYLRQLRDGYHDLLAEVEAGRHAWCRGVHVRRVAWNTDNQSISGIVEELRGH